MVNISLSFYLSTRLMIINLWYHLLKLIIFIDLSVFVVTVTLIRLIYLLFITSIFFINFFSCWVTKELTVYFFFSRCNGPLICQPRLELGKKWRQQKKDQHMLNDVCPKISTLMWNVQRVKQFSRLVIKTVALQVPSLNFIRRLYCVVPYRTDLNVVKKRVEGALIFRLVI